MGTGLGAEPESRRDADRLGAVSGAVLAAAAVALGGSLATAGPAGEHPAPAGSAMGALAVRRDPLQYPALWRLMRYNSSTRKK